MELKKGQQRIKIFKSQADVYSLENTINNWLDGLRDVLKVEKIDFDVSTIDIPVYTILILYRIEGDENDK